MTDAAPGGVSKSDYSFGQVAIRENVCTIEQVKECLDIQTKLRGLGIEPKKLGEILIEKGYVTAEQAVHIAKLQVQAGSSAKVSIPGYEVLSKIGAGAMGTVYKGRQVSMDRIVAIKILASRYAKDSLFVDRFVREARAVAKLNHENIIGGIDVGEAGGLHYFVMEFVDGVGVQAILKREGRIDEKRCLQIGSQIAKALSHAHKHGIVHRDVKPENIMITTGGVAKLCDLGLAKQTKGDTDVTMDGTSVGTPNYISPEQARGEEKIDIRTDIYSLGASLYHMATGTTPFTGANPMVVMTKHVTEYPDPPKKRYPALSEGFSNLVMKMMQKRREDRQQDPDVLLAEIDHLSRGGTIEKPVAAPRAVTSVPRPADRTVHKPSTVRVEGLIPKKLPASRTPLLAGGAVLALVVAGLIFFRGGGESAQSSDPKTSPAAGVKPPSATSGSAAGSDPDRVRREILDFRTWAEKHLAASTPDRFTAPYAQIQKKIQEYKDLSNFAALDSWHEEQNTYVEKANKFISERIWEPIRLRVDEALGLNRLQKAQEEVLKLEDLYKYLGDGRQEKTRAAIQAEERLARIESLAEQAWPEAKQNADRQFESPSTRDQAYQSLDILATQLLARQKGDIDSARLRYFDREVNEIVGTVPTLDKLRQAQDRVAKLRTMHAGNEGATAALDLSARKLREASEDFSKGALAQANALYTTGFKPKFEEALRQRDLLGARRLFATLYLARETAVFQTYFLPAPGMDAALLKSFVDPMRVTPVEARKLASLAEDGWKFCVKAGPGTPDAAKGLYFDLRTAALLEDLVEQALEGARLAGRDANRFKAGYSASLKDAATADPLPRKPGEPVVLAVSMGSKGTFTLSVLPKKDPALGEDDLVALARRAPSAANDPSFALKAFFLCQYGGKLPSAKSWYEKLTPEQRVGLEAFEDSLKGTVSAAAEADAQRLYEEGYALWKKKDETGAVRKFKECLEKYGNTAYMKTPVKLTGGEKSRSQILQDSFKLAAPAGALGPAAPATAKTPKEIFFGAEVRDVGRNRYDLTWTFKEEKELGAFQTVPGALGGAVTVARGPSGGVRLSGSGMWTSTMPFKGDVLCEINLKSEVQKSVGFLVHAQGDRAGYAALVDLDIPGAGQLDAIFKLPLQIGPQLLSSILAQGGKDLEVVKDLPSLARIERVGTKVRLTFNRGSIETDNALFNEGRVGLILPDTTLVVDKIHVVGEVDKAWLTEAQK